MHARALTWCREDDAAEARIHDAHVGIVRVAHDEGRTRVSLRLLYKGDVDTTNKAHVCHVERVLLDEMHSQPALSQPPARFPPREQKANGTERDASGDRRKAGRRPHGLFGVRAPARADRHARATEPSIVRSLRSSVMKIRLYL